MTPACGACSLPHPARAAWRETRVPARRGSAFPLPDPGTRGAKPCFLHRRRKHPLSCARSRAQILVPAHAVQPSRTRGASPPPPPPPPPPPFLPMLQGASSLFLRALGPTPQATRASLPGRTVSALSCGRVARREPSLLECAGPRGRAVQNPTSCARGGARAPTLLPSTTTPPFLLARHGASIPRKLSCRRGPSLPLARATRAPLS